MSNSTPQTLTKSFISQVVLQLESLNKIFNPDTALENYVLHDISLHVSRGELVALVGTSGSGKILMAHQQTLMT
jgi:lipoprotein-releasing system ATP-binding protein